MLKSASLYFDDIVESILRVIEKPPQENKLFDKSNPDNGSSWAPYKIFNIGNSKSIYLLDFIKCLEEEIGIKAIKDYVEMQPGDVKATEADTSEIESYVNFKPKTSLKNGIKNFYAWYKKYYKQRINLINKEVIYQAVRPPSTEMIEPVIYDDASLSKKTIDPLYSFF